MKRDLRSPMPRYTRAVMTLALAALALLAIALPPEGMAGLGPADAPTTQPTPYVSAWNSAEPAIDEDLKHLDEWLGASARDAGALPAALAGRLGVTDPYPEMTALSRATQASVPLAELTRGNWERYASALRGVRNRAADVLAAASTPAGRDRAIDLLQEVEKRAPHPALMPVLLAIARNASETAYLRARAVHAMTFVPRPDLVPTLISFLKSEDRALSSAAYGPLSHLTGYQASQEIWRREGAVAKTPADLVPLYEKWWAEHKDTFDYDAARLRVRESAW